MGNRKQPLITGEYYHIFGRGVEKRNIVEDQQDIERFITSLKCFNTVERIGSVYEFALRARNNKDRNQFGSSTSKLVDVLAYNILPNHYHLILRQKTDDGIAKYMQSCAGGYTKYFNTRYERMGPLFQGKFRSEHIATDAQLRYVTAYVHFNHLVHGIVPAEGSVSTWGERSSWIWWQRVLSGEIDMNETLIYVPDDVHEQIIDLATYEREGIELAQYIQQKRAAILAPEETAREEGYTDLEVELPKSHSQASANKK